MAPGWDWDMMQSASDFTNEAREIKPKKYAVSQNVYNKNFFFLVKKTDSLCGHICKIFFFIFIKS